MGKPNISKDTTFLKENLSSKRRLVLLGFLSRTKTPNVFLFQTSPLTDNSAHCLPSPPMTGNRISQKIPHMLVRKIFFLFHFWFLTFYFSKESTLKFGISAKAHNENAFPWHAILTGTVYDSKNLSAEVNNIPKMFEILFWLTTSSIFILMLKLLFFPWKQIPSVLTIFGIIRSREVFYSACNEMCLDSSMRLLKMIWQKTSHNINK